MRQSFSSQVLLLAFSLAAAGAQAQSVVEQQNERLQKLTEDLNNACKVEFKASIDVDSFREVAEKAEDDKSGNLARHCRGPISALKSWCRLGLGADVGKTVTSLICRYDPKGNSTELKDGVLTVRTTWKSKGVPWERFLKAETGRLLQHEGFSASRAELIRNDTRRITDLNLDMKSQCDGYETPWEVDWKSFEKEIDKRTVSNNLRQVWQECYGPLKAIQLRCNNDQSKLAEQQIKSFVCQYDEDKPQELTLEDGVLILTSNLYKEFQQRWVNEKLGNLLQDGEFTARQTDFIKDEEAGFKRVYSDYYKDDCDAELEWKIDWGSFKKEIDKRLSKEETTSIYSACGVPVDRLRDVCRKDQKSKKKVKKKIKSFECRHGGKRKHKLKLRKGVLRYAVDFGAKDAYAFVDKALVKNRVMKKRPPPKKLSSSDLARIRRVMGQKPGPQQQCKRACSKKCRAASNPSKCKNRCRAGC